MLAMILENWQMLSVFTLVILVFVSFAKELMPPELTAFVAVAVLLAMGILTGDEVLSVLANPAAMTIACMMILSAALEKTGLIDALAQIMSTHASRHPRISILGMLLAVMFASAFVNNTSVVVIMIPVILGLATSLQMSPSKILIPLSFASIMGGTCTLIGTSTNLLVDGVAQERGLAPFTMFEITGIGLLLASVAGVYMLVVGRFLLPDRPTLMNMMDESIKRRFLTEIAIPADSKLVGKSLEDAGFTKDRDIEVIELIRQEDKAESSVRTGLRKLSKSLRVNTLFRDYIDPDNRPAPIDGKTVMEAGDKLILLTNQREVVALQNTDVKETEERSSPMYEEVLSEETVVMEGIIGTKSHFDGKYVGDLNLANKYNIYVLAVHRQHGVISRNFDAVRLKFGDTLLLKGSREALVELFDNQELVSMLEPVHKPFRRRRAPLALASLAAVVGLASMNVAPIVTLAMIFAAFVILVGCLEVSEALDAIHGNILLLIYSMLAVSIAMEKTGGMELVVDFIIAHSESFGPIFLLSALYLLTSSLTEVFSNNAAAVIITPIAIGLAHQMGVDPRPFAVAVMLGASASFATPIGYQTNTLVYNAGGYRFMDFVKIGLPMNILMWIVATFAIPIFWPL